MSSIAEELQEIQDFNALLPFLKKRMNWPIDDSILEDDDPLEEATYFFTADELGINPEFSAQFREIRQVRSFTNNQPFGIFLISFEEKSLKITAMRRILRALAKKKRASSDEAIRQRWNVNDLMFISNFGESGERKLSFAHFQQCEDPSALPVLRVIGWDDDDTSARIRIQVEVLTEQLKFPADPSNIDDWRQMWTKAFSQRPDEIIATTRDLVTKLAKLATQTRLAIQDIMKIEHAEGPLHRIMEAFKKSVFPDLDIKNFADMYAQTVAYGLLQARISLTNKGEVVLEDAATIVPEEIVGLVEYTNPFLKPLFETFLAIGEHQTDIDFDEIGLSAVRDLLNRTKMHEVLADFGRRKPNQDPRIHLYESFLKKYDQIRKKKLGVFYTRQEVVQFIVRSVHETLQNKFGLADGLADITTWAELAASHDGIEVPEGWADRPFVQILDPATGTGTFLIEIIDLIHRYLIEKWQSDGKTKAECTSQWQEYVPIHLLPRLYGFELMMAPYAMAHLGIAMKLAATGYQVSESNPRVEVYLTNTLAQPFDAGKQIEMGFLEDALAEEGKGANRVKRNIPITVVIGNPPYAGHSVNVSKNSRGESTWIGELIKPYFYVDGAPLGDRNPKWLNDDYVKFIRYAESRLEWSGVGLFGYITNHAFLDNSTFRGMRQHLIDGASLLHLMDLHGNNRKKEKAPDGTKDENVFDIEQGVAVTILTRKGDGNCAVFKGDIYGPRDGEGGKLVQLAANSISTISGNVIKPASPNYFLVELDSSLEAEFEKFVSVTQIYIDRTIGIFTANDNLFVAMGKTDLQQKHSISSIELIKENIQKYKYRPFDIRLINYDMSLIQRAREKKMLNLLSPNIALVTGNAGGSVGSPVWDFCFSSNYIGDLNLFRRGGAYFFPLKLLPDGEVETDIHPNFSSEFLNAMKDATCLAFQPLVMRQQIVDVPSDQQTLEGIKAPLPSQQGLMEETLHERGDLTNTFGCRDVFDYIYAILHSPTYRARYAEFLKSQFPRIPIPASNDLFASLVPIGMELMQLHLLDEIHPALVRPAIVFRGQGNNRLATKRVIQWANGKMHINPDQWFEDVPVESVEFSIGGYQPIKKWLHDRAEKGGQNAVPGHILSEADIMHYRRMASAITETQHLMAKIDAVIDQHGGWPEAFGG
jgi:hypothetical protein